MYTVYIRSGQEYNTDPMRRCYNGVHASSEIVWEEWRHWCAVPTEEDAQRQIRLFQRNTQQLKYEKTK